MTDVIRRLAKALTFSELGGNTPSEPLLRIIPKNRPKVLILGVYMGNRRSLINHIVPTLGSSIHCQVTQRWIAIGSVSKDAAVMAATVEAIPERTPKFTLINSLISTVDIAKTDFIMVCDDDVTVCSDFTDRFIGWQQHCSFALAQPARTWNSYVDHSFVRRSLWCQARETRFVEIGPIFSMSRSMAELMLPFDESSPMGWGYDLVWPVIARQHGLKLGIVDAVAIEHSMRARGALYDASNEIESMAKMLSQREHLNAREAFVVLKRFH